MHKISIYLFWIRICFHFIPRSFCMRGLARNGILYIDSWAVYTNEIYIDLQRGLPHKNKYIKKSIHSWKYSELLLSTAGYLHLAHPLVTTSKSSLHAASTHSDTQLCKNPFPFSHPSNSIERHWAVNAFDWTHLLAFAFSHLSKGLIIRPYLWAW